MKDGERKRFTPKARNIKIAAAVFYFMTTGFISAAVKLSGAPIWESLDDDFATGGMMWDLDGDGWLDLVVGNGNDMEREANVAYYNDAGILNRTPSWASANVGYHGHLDMGDVDGDGDADVVVTGFLNPTMLELLYRNDGGKLTRWPAWKNAEEDNSFSCALGDMDGDGDLDLATVSGYFGVAPVRVYKNNGGVLESIASWHTPVPYDANDVAWCDVDADGDLDLAIAGHDSPCFIFYNSGTTLKKVPEWQTDLIAEFNQLTFGDVDGDGWRDMVVSENYPGHRILLYYNRGGELERGFSWSAPIHYASCVKLADVDADGDLDLAAGGWWSPIQVFENRDGAYGAAPAWWYYPDGEELVCEQAVWADVDNDGLRFAVDRFDGDGRTKLFYTRHRPLHYFNYVAVDGNNLEPADYCFHSEDGWLSFAAAPPPGDDNVVISYVYSEDLDLIVTNWDEPAGSYLFNNDRGGVEVEEFRVVDVGGALSVRWRVPAAALAQIKGFNLRRRETAGGPVVKINDALIPPTNPSLAFTDTSVRAGVAYDYWLEVVLLAGPVQTHGPARGVARAVTFALGQNYPNPARGTTTVPFTINRSGRVVLAAYDMAGRRIATWLSRDLNPGKYEVAVNVTGLPPGIYVYELRAPEGRAARRLVVAR